LTFRRESEQLTASQHTFSSKPATEACLELDGTQGRDLGVVSRALAQRNHAANSGVSCGAFPGLNSVDDQFHSQSTPRRSDLKSVEIHSPSTYVSVLCNPVWSTGLIRCPEQLLKGPYHCCQHMAKSELTGPLPSDSETDAYLYRELGIDPGLGINISLALNEQLRSSETSSTRSSPWKSVRVACLLAIRGSEHRALTSNGIFDALIKAVPFCAENSHLALCPARGAKRKGWPVRSDFLYFSSQYKTDSHRPASLACFRSIPSSSRKPLKG